MLQPRDCGEGQGRMEHGPAGTGVPNDCCRSGYVYTINNSIVICHSAAFRWLVSVWFLEFGGVGGRDWGVFVVFGGGFGGGSGGDDFFLF